MVKSSELIYFCTLNFKSATMNHKEEAVNTVEMFDESLNYLACGTNGIEDLIHERAIDCAKLHYQMMIEDLEKEHDMVKFKSDIVSMNQDDFIRKKLIEYNKILSEIDKI